MDTFSLYYARTTICTMFLLVVWSLDGGLAQKTPPAIFIFGDSLADVGNNDYLPLSLTKVNYLPNGIDYQRRNPTGRFCNGRLVLDIVAERMGFQVSLPYLSPRTRGAAILQQGVNYASGGCGILNETNRDRISCLAFSTQLRYHEKTIASISGQLGIDNAVDFLSSSLYFVVMGSNDFIANYLQKNSSDAQKYTPDQFTDLLISSLTQQLMALYSQYARKIVFIGLGPLGCIPSQRAKTPTGDCNDTLNSWILQLNDGIKTLVQDLNSNFSDAKITFANTYSLFQDFIQNPSTYGFNVINEACCGGGRLHAQIPCLPITAYCSNRSDHLFWDPWHPTEAANMFMASSLLSGSPDVVAPWTIMQLVGD